MSGGWQGLEGSAQGIDTRNAQGAGADARAVGPKMPRESRAGQRADFLGQALAQRDPVDRLASAWFTQ